MMLLLIIGMMLLRTEAGWRADYPDYLGVASAAYEFGISDSRHHINVTGEQIDTWALPAALIAKHTTNKTWANRSARSMEALVVNWRQSTGNGSHPYMRSGFVGWAVPLAYCTLRELGPAYVPLWNASFLAEFKSALDAWLNPYQKQNLADGIHELGNWNKGFQHLADAAALMKAFPEIDSWPKNKGVYRQYINRTWADWVTQHAYPENSVGYNGISLQLLINVIPDLVDQANDLYHPDVIAMVQRYASLFDPLGCMPAFGASNTACESPLMFGSAFERMAAVLSSISSSTKAAAESLRYWASVTFGCNKGSDCPTDRWITSSADPISLMLAYDQQNSSIPILPPARLNMSAEVATVYQRLEARDGTSRGLYIPDKMVLAPLGKMKPYCMLELWSTVSLYHEATPQICGDLVEYQYNGTRFTRDTGRKHGPGAAQGNTMVMLPASASAWKMFPWYGAAELIPDPHEWQEQVLPTRFLQVESNDFYTSRWIKDLQLVCTAPPNQAVDFDVYLYGLELVGGGGVTRSRNSSLRIWEQVVFGDNISKPDVASPDNLMPIWPNASFSSDVPPGHQGPGATPLSLKIRCAGRPINSTSTVPTVSTRPASLSPLRIAFDAVRDFTHLRFYWKTSKVFSPFIPGSADCGDDGEGCAMPLALNFSFEVPTKDEHVGEATAPVFGKYAGGFMQSWFYPETSTSSASTFASSNERGDTGGFVKISGMHGRGSEWQRGVVVLKDSGIMMIADSAISPFPPSARPRPLQSFITGPVLTLSPAGQVDGPHRLPGGLTWWDTANYTFQHPWDKSMPTPAPTLPPMYSSQSMLLMMFGGESATSNSSQCNVQMGAPSCRADLSGVRCPLGCAGGGRGEGGLQPCSCPDLHAFTKREILVGERGTFISVLIPYNAGDTPSIARSIVAQTQANISKDGGRVTVRFVRDVHMPSETSGHNASVVVQQVEFDFLSSEWNAQ